MRVFASLFRWIADTFHQLLEGLERFLYSVDEWLRFRSGENRATVVSKAVLGLMWAMVSYVVRICVNLLIEPQLNPIKHFPVVTVSHKILLPTINKVGKAHDRPRWAPLAGISAGPGYRLRVARRVRLPGLGAEGELAAV